MTGQLTGEAKVLFSKYPQWLSISSAVVEKEILANAVESNGISVAFVLKTIHADTQPSAGQGFTYLGIEERDLTTFSIRRRPNGDNVANYCREF